MFNLFSKPNDYINTSLVSQLLEIFPHADIDYLTHCVQEYELSKQVMVEKLLEVELPRSQHNNVKLLTILQVFPGLDSALARELVEAGFYNSVNSLIDKDYKMCEKGKQFDVDEMFKTVEHLDNLFVYLYKKYPYTRKSTIKRVIKQTNGNAIQSIELLDSQSAIFNFSISGVFESKPISNEWQRYYDTIIFKHDCTNDAELSRQLNREQYSELFTCECCCGDSDLESIYVCKQGHFLCHECIKQSVRVGMYDTGVCRGRALKCFSVAKQCLCIIELNDLELILEASLFRNYHLALVEQCMMESGTAVNRCPNCNYFEEESPKTTLEKILETAIKGWKIFERYWSRNGSDFGRNALIICSLACFMYSLKLFYLFYVGSTAISFLYQRLDFDPAIFLVKKYIKLPRFLKLPPPPVLICKNLYCGRISCTKCNQCWKPLHVCYEAEQNSLRTTVELAMSQALIRTCPRCKVRFVKEMGCNKMTCPTCKVCVCYTCGKDITQEGYQHFCNHFRVVPGSKCGECDDCELYDRYSQQELATQAGILAEENWRKEHDKSNI